MNVSVCCGCFFSLEYDTRFIHQSLEQKWSKDISNNTLLF